MFGGLTCIVINIFGVKSINVGKVEITRGKKGN